MMLVHKYVDEYPIEYEAADSLTESVKSKLANMKLIFYHPKRAIAVIENVLFIGLYYNMLIWFPYYFTEIGYASYATHLSVITLPDLFWVSGFRVSHQSLPKLLPLVYLSLAIGIHFLPVSVDLAC